MSQQDSSAPASDTDVQPVANSGPLPIALQLYTLRTLKISPDQLLAAVAEAGFAGVETFGNNLGLPAPQLRAKLDEYGLQAVSTHVSLSDCEADLPSVIRFQKTLGNDMLIVPWLPEEQRGKTSQSWTAMGRRVGTLARRAQHAGMRFMYHNHDFEMVVLDGRPAIDWLMEAAAPDNVGWEIDVAWAQFGGQDPAALLERYSGRVARLHCKDLGTNSAEHGLADVGSGKLDWNAILPAAKAAGVEWYVVEHDYPTDPLASIKRSYDFLAEKL